MSDQYVEGKLDEVPVPKIMRELYLKKISGVLDLYRAREQRRIILDEGEVRTARSNRMEQRIGQYALKSGTINRVQLLQAISSDNLKIPLGQRLIHLGYVSAEELKRRLEGLVRDIITECIGWDSGDYRFQQGRAAMEEDTEIRMSTANIIYHGFRAHASDLMARKMIGDLNAPLIPNPNIRLLFQHISLDQEEQRILDAIDGTASTSQLAVSLPGEAAHNIAVLGSLVAAGLIIAVDDLTDTPMPAQPLAFAESPLPPPADAEPPQPAPSRPPRRKATTGPPRRRATTPASGHAMTRPAAPAPAPKPAATPVARQTGTSRIAVSEAEIERMRKSIRQKYALLSSNDHYRLLGLPYRATQKEVYYSFTNLCTLFHPDLALQEPFADMKNQLEAIFGRLEEAYETLIDTEKRKQYDRRTTAS